MSTKFDVIVIGLGIVGCSCAWALSRRGLRVLAVGDAPIGGGATGAGMGHVAIMDDSEAQFRLTARSAELWMELRDELPPEAAVEYCGTLWIAADEEELAAARSKHAFYQKRGVRTEVLDEQSIAEAEPNLRSGLAGGLRIIDDSIVYPPVVCEWMLTEVSRRGGAVKFAHVTSATRTRVRLADGEMLSAGVVVLAGGDVSAKLCEWLPVRARKGHLVITDRYPGFCRHELVELGYLKNAHSHATESVAFNLQPRPTGQMLLGSSRQYGVEHAEVEARMVAWVIERAKLYMPRIGALRVVRAWTGFRAATPDSLPIIGGRDGVDEPVMATGHEGLGLTTSLGTAELIASILTGAPTTLDAAPYSASRDFGGDGGH